MHVFAGCLYAESEGANALRTNCSDRLHVLQLDVTNMEQIKGSIEYIETHLPSKGKDFKIIAKVFSDHG